jgi:hypothetical protein
MNSTTNFLLLKITLFRVGVFMSIYTCDVRLLNTLQSNVNVGLKYCCDITAHDASFCKINYIAIAKC